MPGLMLLNTVLEVCLVGSQGLCFGQVIKLLILRGKSWSDLRCWCFSSAFLLLIPWSQDMGGLNEFCISVWVPFHGCSLKLWWSLKRQKSDIPESVTELGALSSGCATLCSVSGTNCILGITLAGASHTLCLLGWWGDHTTGRWWRGGSANCLEDGHRGKVRPQMSNSV